MKRTAAIFITLLAAILIAIPAHALTPEAQNALTWLESAQNPSGSWGNTPESTTTEHFSTAAAIEAFTAVGLDNSASFDASSAWLNSTEADNTAYLATRILALYGTDVDLTADIANLVLSKNDDYGWGGHAGYDSSPHHTALVLSALTKAGALTEMDINPSLGYLVLAQNEDGGWGFYKDDTSSTFVTAHVALIMKAYTGYTQVATALNNATDFILAHQNADGGFGSSPSTVYETAMAYEVLIMSGRADLPDMSTALDYLKTTQGTDGSWEGDAYQTALALDALSSEKPNLTISDNDLFLSNPAPGQGELATLYAKVRNTGVEVAGNVLVRFFLIKGETEEQIGEDMTIPEIQPSALETVVVSYNTADAGRSDILVKVDPDNSIDEIDEGDNTATKVMSVLKPVDLRIEARDIILVPDEVFDGMPVSLAIFVSNYGEQAVQNVPVAVYTEAPENGGTLIAQGELDSIAPASKRSVNIDLGLLTIGEYEYYVVVDPLNVINESNEGNNMSAKTFMVKDPADAEYDIVDVHVSPEDITFSNESPVAGERIYIEATGYNSSYRGFSYRDNPTLRISYIDADGGYHYITQIRPAFYSPWSKTKLGYYWTVTEGAKGIVAHAYYNGSAEDDVDTTNNVAVKLFKSNAPDLSITEKDVNLSEFLPEKGQVVDLTATVRNLGQGDASGNVSIYEVASDGAETLLHQEAVALSGLGQTDIIVPRWTYPEKASTIRIDIDGISPMDIVSANDSVSVTYGEDIDKQDIRNEGKEFWMHWNWDQFRNKPDIIIQSKKKASVTIEYDGYKIHGLVTPENPFVSSGRLSGVPNLPIHITSDEEITVVQKDPRLARRHYDETMLGVPVKNLGTEYYNISVPTRSKSDIYGSRFVIVATQDNTHVNLNGTEFVLNKGGRYQQVQRYDTSNIEDWTGYHVRSDKPVAVFAGADCTFISLEACFACDALASLLLPVSLWGNEHITAPLYSPIGTDVIRFLAANDDTTVTVSYEDSTDALALGAGQWHEMNLESAAILSSDKPIEVAQFAKGANCTGGIGDPFEMLIIPTEYARKDYSLYAPPGFDQGNFISVISHGGEPDLSIKGVLVDATWELLPGEGEGVYAMIPISEGFSGLTSSLPVNVYSHGYYSYGSYGHPAGYALLLPDLVVNSPAINTEDPQEGQLVELLVNVANEGEAFAGEFEVNAFYGDPADSDSQLLGSVTASLDQDISQQITLNIDTYGLAEQSNIYIVVDPQDEVPERKEDNNVLMLMLHLSGTDQPDLTVEGLSFASDSVQQGEMVNAHALIRNRGVDTGGFSVVLYNGDPAQGGTLLAESVVNEILPANGEITVSFDMSTFGMFGEQEIYAYVDPENVINESREDNNTFSSNINIHGKGLELVINTDSNAYEANNDVGITLELVNKSWEVWSGTGSVRIVDGDNRPIADLESIEVDSILPIGLEGWSYRVPAALNAISYTRDDLAVVELDFAQQLESIGADISPIDQNSIRILETDDVGNILDEKQAVAEFTSSTDAKVTWLVDGKTDAGDSRHFYIYFDTLDNGEKEPSGNTNIFIHKPVIAYGTPATYILTQNEYGDFVEPMGLGVYGQVIELGDLSNNGYPDLLAGYNYSVKYFKSSSTGVIGSGLFGQEEVFWSGTYVSGFAIGDFDNDGNNDYIVNKSGNAPFYLYLSNGDGTYNSSRIDVPLIDSFFSIKSAADFNNDGNDDFITRDSHGRLYIYISKGDGTFESPVSIPGSSRSRDIAVADFNNDGNMDYVIDNLLSGSYLIPGNGDGTFGDRIFLPLTDGLNLRRYTATDINGDGNADLIAMDAWNYKIISFSGNGDGTFGPQEILESYLGYAYAIDASRPQGRVFPVLGIPEAIEPLRIDFAWDTGNAFSGNYMAYAFMNSSEGDKYEASVPFTIIPDISIQANVTSDKISYSANDEVSISSTITSLSANTIMENVVASVTLLNPEGLVKHTEAKSIPLLVPGQTVEFNAYWSTAQHQPGTYTATLSLIKQGDELSAASTTFIVLGTASSPDGEGLVGTISATPELVRRGDDETIVFTVTNMGNEDISGLSVTVLIVNPVDQSVEQSYGFTENLAVGDSSARSLEADTTSLEQGTYMTVLQVKTSAMAEPRTLASDTFELEAPSIEGEKSAQGEYALRNVLVWLNYQWPSGTDCPDVAQIEAALNAAGIDTYTLVFDKKDFQSELRNPFYSDYMIIGDQHPLEGHYADELKQKVFMGRGLIASMYNRQSLNEDVFGIKFRGSLSDEGHPVEIVENDILQPAVFNSSGRVLKVDALDEGDVLGWVTYADKKKTYTNPAALAHSYGLGNSVFMAFDLGHSEGDYSLYTELLRDAFEYVHTSSVSVSGPYYPNQLVPVSVSISALGGEMDISVEETYPDGMALYDFSTASWIDENPWIQYMQVGPDAPVETGFLALLPSEGGQYTLKTDISYLEGSEYVEALTLELPLTVLSTSDLAQTVIDELEMLSVSSDEAIYVTEAIAALESINGYALSTEEGMELAIDATISAIRSIEKIADADTFNAMMASSRLLESLESGRYFQ